MSSIKFGTSYYPMELIYTIAEPDEETRSIKITINNFKITVKGQALQQTYKPYTWAYAFNDGKMTGPHSASGTVDIVLSPGQSKDFGTAIERTFKYKEDGTIDPEYEWGTVNIDYSFRTPFAMDVADISHQNKNITNEIPRITDIRQTKITNLSTTAVQQSVSVSYQYDQPSNGFQYAIRTFGEGVFSEWKDTPTPIEGDKARKYHFDVTGLIPGTRYEIKVRIKRKDSGYWSQPEYKADFTTLKPDAAKAGKITLSSKTYNSLTLTASDFIVNVPATIAHYDFSTNGWQWNNNGLSSTYTFKDLRPNQQYKIFASIVDNFETRSESVSKDFITDVPPQPQLDSAEVTEVTPFTAKIIPGLSHFTDGYSELQYYQYNLNNAGWITVGKTAFIITDLKENTLYNIQIRVIDNFGTPSESVTTSFKTLVDQVKVDIKRAGVYEKGRLWYKINNKYVKAKHVYVRVNGVYVESKREWS